MAVYFFSCMYFAPLESDGRRWRRVLRLLQATHIRPPNFSCFNMHEWAMLYQPADEATAADGHCSRFQKHLPLRVSQATINRTVGVLLTIIRGHAILCMRSRRLRTGGRDAVISMHFATSRLAPDY